MIHTSYKKKLFLYFLIVFAVFAAIIAIAQRYQERKYKTENLQTNLANYALIVEHFIDKFENIDSTALHSFISVFPRNLRLTIIDQKGNVKYDNSFDFSKAENHLSRPEITSARINGFGSAIHYSKSTTLDYYYYALKHNQYYIRVALPYDLKLQNFVKSDNIFLYFIILLFIGALLLLFYLSGHFGKAISSLNDFLSTAENNKPDYDKIKFPDTELGEIGQRIVTTFRLLETRQSELQQEREKLLRHLHYSEEGIAIFSQNHTPQFANTHFIQYLSTISDEPQFDISVVFKIADFKNMIQFLNQNIPVNPQMSNLPVYNEKFIKNGKYYAIKLLIFNDNNFEISINDITSIEKNRQLKQEMTNNIAHELKTPVSCIRGYIETLCNNPEIDSEQRMHFLNRTYTQIIRLSDLIRDVTLITKTEEASEYFEKSEVNLYTTANDAATDFMNDIQKENITFKNLIGHDIKIEGNYTLLHSIFRNLIENAVKYGGANTSIVTECYMEDSDYYYFSFYDTGKGVDEEHLDKIFNRFYRINEGRSRKTGGSGLGLAIVKNAILFHKGRIVAKNRKEGGLEFIFTLQKRF